MNSSFTAADSNSSGHSVLKRDRQVSTASAGWSQLTPQLTTAWNTHTLSEQCAHMLNTAFVLWVCHILWGSEPWGWKAEDRHPRTLSSETQNTHYSLIITNRSRVLRWGDDGHLDVTDVLHHSLAVQSSTSCSVGSDAQQQGRRNQHQNPVRHNTDHRADLRDAIGDTQTWPAPTGWCPEGSADGSAHVQWRQGQGSLRTCYQSHPTGSESSLLMCSAE